MNNYEKIKNMSLEEMAAVFYMFLNPLIIGFELTKEQSQTVKASIMSFLTAETGKANET